MMYTLIQPIMELRNIAGVACYVFLIVLIAISIDLAAGLRKAKQAGKCRTSYALRRTVTKFIQYEGSILIAFAIDSMLQFCQIWEYLTIFKDMPIITLAVGIYNCICEFFSVRENADRKTKTDHREIDEKMLKIIKELGPDKIKKIISIFEQDEPKKKK